MSITATAAYGQIRPRGIGYKEGISARKRFPARAIWHQTVDPRTGRTTVYASGLTNVTDLAFDGRTLYAVQISTEGLLTGPTGSVVEVRPGPSNHTTVAGGLFAPYGIAISNGSAYVTTGALVKDAGQVLRIRL